MGLPAGHVTDPAIGLTRNQQLKALGNGVVPQQAAHALRLITGATGHTSTDTGALLPTPNPFHMGNQETPDEWLERRADVQQRTGTRHGPALGVVAQSVTEGAPLIQDGDGPRRIPNETICENCGNDLATEGFTLCTECLEGGAA